MPDRLSLADIQDLAGDPRMQNPQVRAQVFAKLDPSDADAVTTWLNKDSSRAPNLTDTIAKFGKSAVQYAGDHPTETGAMLGGLAAMPATGGLSALPALGLTGLAGAGGAGFGMLAGALGGSKEQPPTTIPDALKRIAVQGATQATGEGLGRVTRGAGNLLMNEIVPSDIAKAFPTVNIGETLNARGIVPTTARGAAKAETLRNAAAGRAQSLADDATAKGTPGITRRDLAPFLARAERQAGNEEKAGAPGGMQEIDDRLNALFDAQFPFGDVPLKDAPGVTRALQDEGAIVRKQLDAGNRPTNLGGVTADSLASGVRRTAADRIPGYDAANKQTQELVAAARTADRLKNAPIRLGGMSSRIASGAAGAGGLATGDPLTAAVAAAVPLAIGTPQISAPLAVTLYKAGKLPLPVLAKILGPAALRELGIGQTVERLKD